MGPVLYIWGNTRPMLTYVGSHRGDDINRVYMSYKIPKAKDRSALHVYHLFPNVENTTQLETLSRLERAEEVICIVTESLRAQSKKRAERERIPISKHTGLQYKPPSCNRLSK